MCIRDRLYTALRGLPVVEAPAEAAWRARFEQAMDDDFNTPEALAVLFDLARETNRLRPEDPTEAARSGASLRYLGGLLGLLQSDAELYLQAGSGEVMTAELTTSPYGPERIDALIAERTAARQAKRWAEADRIRGLLQGAGVVLEDTSNGTVWRRE